MKNKAKNYFVVEDCLHLTQPREVVWRRLNDPDVLGACIRGCERVEKSSETDYFAVIAARLGEFRREFKVALTVEDAEAPEKYTLVSGVNAGWLGCADGRAEVQLRALDESTEATELHYVATITLDGLIGKFTPVIEPLAKKRVREFFNEFETKT